MSDMCLLCVIQAPVYLREYARVHFTGSKALQTKVSDGGHVKLSFCFHSLADSVLCQDDLDLLAASSSPAQRTVLPLKRTAVLGPSSQEHQSPAQQYTEEALKELFRHVHHNMPDSAKKKKLVRQVHVVLSVPDVHLDQSVFDLFK